MAENNQQLAFEPAELKGKSTLGGVLATNNSGSSRPFWGSARDSVLGVKLINGLGQHLTFGGQVMKNVAGYDVSRLQAGAMGTLGILSEISLRVMPIPECELTLVKESDAAEALIEMRKITRQPHPISGLTWHKGVMYTRLSGTRNSVREAERQLGGDAIHDKMFWNEIREFQLLKTNHRSVYRLSVAPDAPLFHAIDESFIDWAGGLRWLLNTDEQFDTLCSLAEKYGGHASSIQIETAVKMFFTPFPNTTKHSIKE
ncbi:hypothetical protein [Veronia nyctiphanis]|uniref:hypothetical protein n=1 Tax=Veronia nyctiphanis TaxID=1278244 RepID=UPI001F44A96C|nr:hypothetical protein [Veronia nyctiphanis]